MVKCAVFTCKNYQGNKINEHKVRFFRFPSEPAITAKWIQACGTDITNVREPRICSDHFTENDYRLQDILLNVPVNKRLLKQDAIPSLNLNASIDKNETSRKRKRKQILQDRIDYHDRICRTCLCPQNDDIDDMNHVYSIESESNKSIAEILMSFSNVQIQQNDNLPQKICNECIEKIIMIYNYKNEIEKNEKFLLKCFKNKNHIKNIQTENKQNNNDDVTNKNNEDQIILLKMEKEENTSQIETENSQIEDYKSPSFEMVLVEETSSYLFCTDCTFTTKSKKILDAHIWDHYQNKNLTTETVSLENKNLKSHTHKKIIECKICDTKFNTISNLIIHLHSHKTIESFKDITFENNEIKKLLDPFDEMNRNDIIELIVTQIKQENFMNFYSITNDTGDELYISDSETEVDDGDNNDDDSMNCAGAIKKSSSYTCELCNMKFNRKYKILQHQNNEHSTEVDDNHRIPYVCTYCQKKFVSQQLLEHHLKIQCENSDAIYKCDISDCNKRFMWYENFLKHKRIQHSILVTEQKTEEEEKKEEEEEEEKGDKCDREEENLKNQSNKSKKKSSVASNRDRNFTCETCKKSYLRKHHLKRHEETHKLENRKYECEICHKMFTRNSDMKRHLVIHDVNPQQDYNKKLCVYCGRRLSNSSNLTVHLRRHTGEKPYKCEICGKGFPRSFDLNCHTRTHTGEKPCLCTICGKGFSRSNKLVRHMRIHTGDKPYKCTYCDRAFTQSNDLTLHIRRHTGDKPYVCGICGARFIQNVSLKTHRRSKGHFEDDTKIISKLSVDNPYRNINFKGRNHGSNDNSAVVKQQIHSIDENKVKNS